MEDTCIENFIEHDWVLLEKKAFKESINCYKAMFGEKIYRAIGPDGTISKLDKIPKKKNETKLLMFVVADSETYLDNALNPLIPYGFWTCACETKYVRTPFSSYCPLCQCNIATNTKKARYIEDVIEMR